VKRHRETVIVRRLVQAELIPQGTPIELGRTFVRGDRTRYYVERVVIRPHWTRPDGDEEEAGIDEIASRAAAHGH